jgi:hypothetical protein
MFIKWLHISLNKFHSSDLNFTLHADKQKKYDYGRKTNSEKDHTG